MSIDDYFREQRWLKELMGIGQTASAIAEAHRTIQPLGGLLGSGYRSAVEEIALGLRGHASGSVGAYLREQQSFSTRISSEFLVGRDAATTATALARQYGDQIGALNDRIQRDYLGGGYAESLRKELTGTAIARRAEVGAIARATNWSSGLLARDEGALSHVLKASRTANEEMARLQRMATGIVDAGDLVARASRGVELAGIRDATTLRMSAFAGALDTFGPRASLGQAAFDALLGTWHTRPDLPPAFWRDRPTRARFYRDADVDPGFALVIPHVSTAAMSVFPAEFAATIAPGRQVVMVLDQAGWHGAKALVVPDTITLVPLPPYCPDLNPVERIRLYLRERFLSHRLLADLDTVINACRHAWKALADEPERVRSLTAYPYLKQVNAQVQRYQGCGLSPLPAFPPEASSTLASDDFLVTTFGGPASRP